MTILDSIVENKFSVVRILGVEGATPDDMGEMTEINLIGYLCARRITDDIFAAQRLVDEVAKVGALAVHYKEELGTKCRLDIQLI